MTHQKDHSLVDGDACSRSTTFTGHQVTMRQLSDGPQCLLTQGRQRRSWRSDMPHTVTLLDQKPLYRPCYQPANSFILRGCWPAVHQSLRRFDCPYSPDDEWRTKLPKAVERSGTTEHTTTISGMNSNGLTSQMKAT